MISAEHLRKTMALFNYTFICISHDSRFDHGPILKRQTPFLRREENVAKFL